jgi:hypothetical protein
MTTTQQLAKHLRDVHFGGNWTCSNLRDVLKDITWQQATTPIHSFNTIAILTWHVSYYVTAQLEVLQGKPLHAKDELSFTHPSIHSQEDWERIQETIWGNAEKLACLIEQLPDEVLQDFFTDEKYGTYFRNLQGNIEHMHYHLGQMIIIKKLLNQH